jgi:carotenoid cleavage dioxygenase-like enzyme
MARTKVVVIAEIEDPEAWERGFRTHGDLFKSQTVKKPIDFAITGNHAAVCFKPDDLDRFMEILDSPATAEAMEFDGVKRETVRVFVLDKKLKV